MICDVLMKEMTKLIVITSFPNDSHRKRKWLICLMFSLSSLHVFVVGQATRVHSIRVGFETTSKQQLKHAQRLETIPAEPFFSNGKKGFHGQSENKTFKEYSTKLIPPSA